MWWMPCFPPRPSSSIWPPARGPQAARGALLVEDLVVVFTRPSNLAKKLPDAEAGAVDPALFEVPAEGVLFEAARGGRRSVRRSR